MKYNHDKVLQNKTTKKLNIRKQIFQAAFLTERLENF